MTQQGKLTKEERIQKIREETELINRRVAETNQRVAEMREERKAALSGRRCS